MLLPGFKMSLALNEDGMRSLLGTRDNFTVTIGALDVVFKPRVAGG